MWALVVVFLASNGNYVVTTHQYDFNSYKACAAVRAELASRLAESHTILTECVEDK